MVHLKRRVKVILGVVLGIVVIGGVAFTITGKQMEKKIAKQVNVVIDMDKVSDGTYEGESDAGIIKVKVRVEVKEHKITNVEILEHDDGMGGPAEAMVDDMVAENTDDVDLVSGATMSSKTIRNAVNIALQKGLGE